MSRSSSGSAFFSSFLAGAASAPPAGAAVAGAAAPPAGMEANCLRPSATSFVSLLARHLLNEGLESVLVGGDTGVLQELGHVVSSYNPKLGPFLRVCTLNSDALIGHRDAFNEAEKPRAEAQSRPKQRSRGNPCGTYRGSRYRRVEATYRQQGVSFFLY